jgi:hypothetical protein
MIEVSKIARILEELWSFLFYTLYIWTATFVAPLVLSFHDFFYSFFFF